MGDNDQRPGPDEAGVLAETLKSLEELIEEVDRPAATAEEAGGEEAKPDADQPPSNKPRHLRRSAREPLEIELPSFPVTPPAAGAEEAGSAAGPPGEPPPPPPGEGASPGMSPGGPPALQAPPAKAETTPAGGDDALNDLPVLENVADLPSHHRPGTAIGAIHARQRPPRQARPLFAPAALAHICDAAVTSLSDELLRATGHSLNTHSRARIRRLLRSALEEWAHNTEHRLRQGGSDTP